MILICFRDSESKRRALGFLAGRFSFKSWATGEMAVPALHKPPGQWNEWEVTCIGSKLALKVNGKLAWQIDHFKPGRAPIGIEAEGHPIEFRNLRVKTGP